LRKNSHFNKCCWENWYLLVQERAGNALEAIGIGKDFLSRTQMAQQLRERIDKWDYMKLKTFCRTKEMVYKLKRLPTE
jgi:hypothetical protein